MRWLSRGLCVCCWIVLLTACAHDKKLPVGERISILDDVSVELNNDVIKPISLPVAYINNSWSQNGINSQHIVGNLKASTTLEEIWSENFGKGINKRDIVLATPVAQDGRIFVMDAKGKVSAFNSTNGTLLWENSLTAKDINVKDLNSKASGLAIDNSLVYATTGFGGVYAMDGVTGNPKWRKVMESPIRIAPTITAKAILIQTVDNKLYALDKMTGNELWRFGVAHEDTVIAGGASPAYSFEDNIVVAGFSNGELIVLNANTGSPLWAYTLTSTDKVNSSTEINTISSYPIIENGSIYAISNGDKLV
ncbi:MAG: PQQ-like beta-propeller repeat protein, partial [Alphaproteobacteria bacterium]|nr:PQQ-like beta-propeller repeat protein [Alphaproteobacteria bacterium]